MNVVARVIGNEQAWVRMPIVLVWRMSIGDTSVLGETDQGFGEANLPEHLVVRNGAFARCVEEYMRLLLSILVIVAYWATRFKQRVIDGQVEEGGRQSAHLPLLVESKPRQEQLG
jgi:hypothetical protein